MTVIKKYDFTGKEIGELAIEDKNFPSEVSSQMVKDYIVAMRRNARQWSASTKGRSEVNHTGKKPHPQKGLGRSRQGCLAAPQYKGGGRVFGPKPKFDQHVRINKKERRLAIRHLLAEKLKAGRLIVLSLGKKEVKKTKEVDQFLKKLEIKGHRVLVLADLSKEQDVSSLGRYDGFIRSMKNLSKIEFVYLPNVNGYDLALCQNIVLMEGAWDELEGIFEKRSGV